ncbi:tumor necrosis factor receptor superfamily member 11B-like [Neosynchiropus ocellatus]
MFEMLTSVLLLLVICLSPVRADPFKTYAVRDLDSNALLECDACPPGTYLVSVCTATQKTVCSPCPAGSFLSFWNTDRECLPCQTCDFNQHMTSECQADSDRQCECHDGYYSEDGGETCLPHSQCPAGEGVLHEGTLTADTECQSCPNGTFSSYNSDLEECVTHNSCESEGIKLLLPGTSWHNNICVKCDSPRVGEAVEYLEGILSAFFNYHAMSREVLCNILYKVSGVTHQDSYHLSSSEVLNQIYAWAFTATAAQLENLPTVLQIAGAKTQGEKLQAILLQLEQNLESVCG